MSALLGRRGVFRSLEAEEADCAPPVVLEATHEAVLRDVEPDLLRDHEYEGRIPDESGFEPE